MTCGVSTLSLLESFTLLFSALGDMLILSSNALNLLVLFCSIILNSSYEGSVSKNFFTSFKSSKSSKISPCVRLPAMLQRAWSLALCGYIDRLQGFRLVFVTELVTCSVSHVIFFFVFQYTRLDSKTGTFECLFRHDYPPRISKSITFSPSRSMSVLIKNSTLSLLLHYSST